MIKKRRAILAAVLLGVFLGTPLLTAQAHHAVLHFNLEEMVATADRIFVGKCIDVKETEETIAKGDLPVTYYTFAVSEVIKGQVPSVFTFKQLGHRGRKPSGNKVEPLVGGYVADPKSYVHGMSTFRVGDEMVLMLIPQYMGGQLTYPVGLYQGAFYITRSSSGKALVKNGINNRGLFTNPYNNYKKRASEARVIFPDADRPITSTNLGQQKLGQQNIEAMVSKPGALPLDDFLGLVRAIVNSEK